MGSTTQQDQYDGTSGELSKLPPFVRIPTGEYEVTDDGELDLDEDGNPKAKTQAYLVRRTGTALKEIFRIETDANILSAREEREENEMWDREEKEREDDSIENKYKVDLDFISERRKKRGDRAVDTAYESLSYLLVHPKTGEHPDPQILIDNLDFVVVRTWMTDFVPAQAMGENGEPVETPTDAGSGEAPGVGN